MAEHTGSAHTQHKHRDGRTQTLCCVWVLYAMYGDINSCNKAIFSVPQTLNMFVTKIKCYSLLLESLDIYFFYLSNVTERR